MIGRVNGVAAILKKENPYLIAIHCAAHRLALASSQAATGISVIVQYRKTLSAIYSHFSHSTVHTQELLTVQKVLDEPEIKIKKLYDIRWLSFHNVVDTIRRSLTSLFVYFENAMEEGDPTATGIHRSITTYLFLALTHLLDDVLSILAKLSLNFQRQNLNISLVQPKVLAVIDAINSMKVHDGPKLCEFKKAYDDGSYVLYQIKDSASQQLSFANARRDFLTKLEKNLQDRFVDSSILSAFRIIDPLHFSSTHATFGEEELEVIIQHFCKTSSEEEEYSPPLNPAELHNEFQMFRPFFIIRNFPQTDFYKFSTMFLCNFSDMFPQMALLISIALIITVSSLHVREASV